MCNIKHSSSFVWRKFEGEPFTTLESFALALFPPHTHTIISFSLLGRPNIPPNATHPFILPVGIPNHRRVPLGEPLLSPLVVFGRQKDPTEIVTLSSSTHIHTHKRTNSSLNSISDLHLRTLQESNYIRTHKHAHTQTVGFSPKNDEKTTHSQQVCNHTSPEWQNSILFRLQVCYPACQPSADSNHSPPPPPPEVS